MIVSEQDRALIAAIQNGLPLVSHPYAHIGEQLGLDEQQVIERLQTLKDSGAIRRLGVVVRHRQLGYRANAMVVWDVPDNRVAELGHCFSQFEYITLCYQRPRRLPQWRYNLFCMIHGQDRDAVMINLKQLISSCSVEDIPNDVLFSRQCFKQRGALYVHNSRTRNRAAGENNG